MEKICSVFDVKEAYKLVSTYEIRSDEYPGKVKIKVWELGFCNPGKEDKRYIAEATCGNESVLSNVEFSEHGALTHLQMKIKISHKNFNKN